MHHIAYLYKGRYCTWVCLLLVLLAITIIEVALLSVATDVADSITPPFGFALGGAQLVAVPSVVGTLRHQAREITHPVSNPSNVAGNKQIVVGC
jgi:hypothetical protein